MALLLHESQLRRLTRCNHDVKGIQAVKITIEQIRTLSFSFERTDRYLSTPELVADYLGCFVLNDCYRISVRCLRAATK